MADVPRARGRYRCLVRFELLVKRYDGGVVSQHLHGLQIGSRVAFKHVHSNLRAQYPFAGKGSVTMLAAGSGITPIIQALHKILFTPGDERKVAPQHAAHFPRRGTTARLPTRVTHTHAPPHTHNHPCHATALAASVTRVV